MCYAGEFLFIIDPSFFGEAINYHTIEIFNSDTGDIKVWSSARYNLMPKSK